MTRVPSYRVSKLAWIDTCVLQYVLKHPPETVHDPIIIGNAIGRGQSVTVQALKRLQMASVVRVTPEGQWVVVPKPIKPQPDEQP